MHTYPVAPEEEMVTVYMYTVPGRLHTCTGGGAALCADLCEAGAPSSSSSRCVAGTSEGYGVRGLPVHLSRRRYDATHTAALPPLTITTSTTLPLPLSGGVRGRVSGC